MSGNGTSVPFNVTYFGTTDASDAATAARGFDVVVVVVATNSREAHDRPSLFLPLWQDNLVTAVAAANPNTVVVARCPGACHMPWKDAVSAVLFELLPGQESGNSIATTIFGDNVPSG